MFIVHGKKQCRYCSNAINYLRDRGFDFKYLSMDDKLQDLKDLSTTYNWRTVPLIIEIIDGEEHFVGGYDNLVERFENKTSEEDDLKDNQTPGS